MCHNTRSVKSSNQVNCNQGQRECNTDIGGNNVTKIDFDLCSVVAKKIVAVIYKSFCIFLCVKCMYSLISSFFCLLLYMVWLVVLNSEWVCVAQVSVGGYEWNQTRDEVSESASMRFTYLLVNKSGSHISRLLEGGTNSWVRKERWFITHAIAINENGNFVPFAMDYPHNGSQWLVSFRWLNMHGMWSRKHACSRLQKETLYILWSLTVSTLSKAVDTRDYTQVNSDSQYCIWQRYH